MSLAVYCVIGAIGGAMLGSGAGATAYTIKKKKQRTPPEPPAMAESAIAEPPEEGRRNPRPVRHEVFGVPTRYFTSNSEFYVPLTRLEEYLQWDPETALFQAIVARIDVFIGQHLLLASGKSVSGVAIPVEAQKIRNDVMRALREIVDFSDAERKSTMKRAAMTELVSEIQKLLDGNITNMHRVVASRPLRASPAQP